MTAGPRAPGLVSSPRQLAAVLLSLALAAAGLWLDRGAGAAGWGRSWRGGPPRVPLGAAHAACPYPGAASCRPLLEDRLGLRLASQLEDLQRICPWRPFTSCRGLDRSGWTAAARTQACCHTPGGLGQWHTLTLTTLTRDGQRRCTGGDVWSVRLVEARSGAALGARVLDNGDGTYTVAFVPAVPGVYRVEAWLYSSACLGYQDLPGNATAAWGEQDRCFIAERVELPAVSVKGGGEGVGHNVQAGAGSGPVAGSSSLPHVLEAPEPLILRAQQHVVVAAGGYAEWQPLPAAQQRLWQQASAPPARIVLFGDSTAAMPAMLLGAAARRPCHISTTPGQFSDPNSTRSPAERCGDMAHAGDSLYRNLTLFAPFAGCRQHASQHGAAGVEVTTVAPTMRQHLNFLELLNRTSEGSAALRVHFVFAMGCNDSSGGAELLSLLRQTLHAMAPSDTLILNFGLHCVKQLALTDWLGLVSEAARLLAASGPHRIVWRGSLPIQEHAPWGWLGVGAREYPGPRYHFLTESRRLVYELHARRAMLAAGVRVLDLDGLPVVYQDALHWDLEGCDFLNRVLSWSVC